MNKAINIKVLAIVDLLKEFKKKLAYYISIFAIVFGSTFVSFNAANAVDQTAVAKNSYTDGQAMVFTATTATTVLASADQLTSFVNTADTDTVYALSGAFKLDITGGTWSIKALSGDSITVNMATSGGSLDLGQATLGTVIINTAAGAFVDVTAADTHTFTLDGSAAFAGLLEVSATTTFSGAIGATNGLAEINVDTGTVGTFSSTVKATTIELTGDAVFATTVTATTISLVAGKATFNNTAAVTIAGAITESEGAIGNKQWTKECDKDNEKNCMIAVNHQVSVPDSDKKITLATAYIQLGSTTERKMDLVDGEEKTYKLKEENKSVPVLFIKLPLNVNLKKSPLVQIDKKNIFNLPFSHCNAQDGCVTTVVINDEIIKLLKAGKELTVVTGVYGRKENLSINFPLKGFSKSYDSLLK